ncbi:MAG: class I mannose-6-phosphate isomerase [Ruminococcus sp.]|nr:class I mannose-6-phosphate isomerase [Ruminococcus sp.]
MVLNAPINDYIWGGTKLREQFGKESDLERLAESWELSCHKDGHSVIAEGEYKGRTLAEYLEENPDAMGKNCERFENFPVLIKLIDARDNLSVQVHPDNEYALRVEGEYGKTEMWYIVDCDEGASLIFGFKEEISKEEFRRAIEENTLLDKVNTVPVKKGDVFFIEAGTLHAIGKGILIAEIQQNSNTTYRVYDYGRVGADGKPRELHVEKALDVTNLEQKRAFDDKKTKVNLSGCEVEVLATCEYFSAVLLEVQGSSAFETDEKSFTHMLVTEGEAEAVFDDTAIKLKKGSSIFVPAGTGMCRINGNASIIITSVN